MHRIDTEGHSGNLFQDTVDPKTIVSADWLNFTAQEELANVVEAPESGQALVKAREDQLLEAVRKHAGYRTGDVNLLNNSSLNRFNRNTGSDTLSGTTAKYIPDRWRCQAGTGGAATVSQQSHAVAGSNAARGKPVFLQWVQGTGGSTAPTIEQRLAGVEQFDAQSVTVSFWARVSSGTIQIRPRITQNFGSGGSANVDTDGSLITINSTWTRYTQTIAIPSISGKTIGSGTPWTSLVILFPTSSTFTFQLDAIQLQYGPQATEYAEREQDKEECETFYWKTYPPGQAPGSASITAGARYGHHGGGTPSVYAAQFFHLMRNIPTVTWYSPTTGAASRVESPVGGADRTVTQTDHSSAVSSGVPVLAADPGAGSFRAHVTLEAEL